MSRASSRASGAVETYVYRPDASSSSSNVDVDARAAFGTDGAQRARVVVVVVERLIDVARALDAHNFRQTHSSVVYDRALAIGGDEATSRALSEIVRSRAKTADVPTPTNGGVKRLRRDGVEASCLSRLCVFESVGACVARASGADACVVDVEDGRGVSGTATATAACAFAAGGPRIVVVRSPRACAVATHRGECVDGTRACGAGFWDAVFETRDDDADADEDASTLWGNAWASDFAATTTVDATTCCRFHNYAARGCEKATSGETCSLDHETCCYCLEKTSPPHRAYECDVLAAHARRARATTATTAMREAKVLSPGERYRERVRSRDADAERKPYVYVVGGRNRGLTVGVCERYDVAANAWERAPRLNEPRGSHGACAVGSKIFVVSGGGVKSNLASAETLDASAPDAAWTLSDDVVQPRHAMSSTATTNGKVYTVGGWFNGAEAVGTTDVCDARTGAWSTAAALGSPRRLHGVCALGVDVFVFGGMTQDGVETATAERYDATTNTWRAIASLPAPACAAACASGNDCFVFAWGSSSPRGDAAHSGGFYRYDSIDDSYENLGELPLKNWFGFAVCADARDDVLYAVGGAVGGRWTGRAFAYHVGERAWEEIATMSYVRRRTAAACVYV